MQNSRLHIVLLCVTGLVRATTYRFFSRGGKMLKLPPMSPLRGISDEEIDRIGKNLKRVINVLHFWHPGPCFLRAYTILYVLRNLGVSVDMNFGLVDPFGKKRKQLGAHCWLSRQGKLYLEDPFVLRKYPKLLARTPEGLIYWTGDNLSTRKQIMKKEAFSSSHFRKHLFSTGSSEHCEQEKRREKKGPIYGNYS